MQVKHDHALDKARLDRAVEIMRANKLSFDPDFGKILSVGVINDECYRLFKNMLAEIEAILLVGVNYNFNGKMKTCIKTLTKLASQTCYKDDVYYFYDKKDAALAKLSMPEIEEAHNLRKIIKAYAEDTKSGMDFLRGEKSGGADDAACAANERLCLATLDGIVKTVNGVVDFRSKKAVEIYEEIVDRMHKWRSGIAKSSGFFDYKTVNALKDIADLAKEWAMLSTAEKVRPVSAEQRSVPLDDLTNIVESENTYQDVKMFLGRCDDYVYSVCEKSKDEEVRAAVRAYREKLSGAERALQKLAIDKREGRIGEAEYEDAYFEISNEAKNIRLQLGRVKLDAAIKGEMDFRRELISRIEQPIRSSYRHVKHNRLHVHMLFANIDFARIVAVLNNNVFDPNEMNDAIDDIHNALVTRGIIDYNGNLLMSNIKEKLGAEYDAAWSDI